VVGKLGKLFIAGSFALLVACGGGGGGGSGNSSVAVSCSPSTLHSGETAQCSATVSGTAISGSAVTWNVSAGQISSSGLLTAPIVSATQSVNVQATSMDNANSSGKTTETVTPTQLAANVAPLVVDPGPVLQSPSVNLPFVTITICSPPGTDNCQTIDHVLVDTGSYGLRIISSVLTIPLAQEYDASNNPLYECTNFSDGFVWGPVQTADITIAGEKAGAVPVQVMIPPEISPAVPRSCSNQSSGSYGNLGGSVEDFGANAIIGLGVFQQDCGAGCTSENPTIPDFYYTCPTSSCRASYATLEQQVTNPVAMFPSDNNGVLIQLPSVPSGGAPQVDGFLIFGIGTASNNGLGSATVYPVPDGGIDAGNFTTIFNNTSYSGSFMDSGSNGMYFLDTAATGVETCSGSNSSWYCPATLDHLTAINEGSDQQPGPVTSFGIENANYLFNTNNIAFSTLGGPNPGNFDWGLSFFFGRNVFTAIENRNTPAGYGPYYGYNLP
jgi:hypothetical protein